MGAAQSSPKAEHVVTPQEQGTSVEFAPSLIARLASPEVSSAAAAAAGAAAGTDELVRRRLASESAALRAKEAEILSSISAALEKENLDKDKGLSSEVLGRDIEEVRDKVARMAAERGARESAEMLKAKDEVVACYKVNATTPLNCWEAVAAFKAEVGKLETAFVKSLQ